MNKISVPGEDNLQHTREDNLLSAQSSQNNAYLHLNESDLRKLCLEQQALITSLQQKINNTNATAASIVPGVAVESKPDNVIKGTEFLANMADGYIELDENLCYSYVNPVIEQITGCPASFWLGKNIWDVYANEVGSPTWQAIQKAFTQKVNTTAEDYFPALGIWHKSDIYPTPHGLSILIKDITVIKKTELQLKETCEIGKIGGWEADLIERKVQLSSVARTILGIEHNNDVSIQESIDFLLAGNRYDENESIRQRIDAGILLNGSFDEEVNIALSNGTEKWLHIKARAEFVGGSPVRLLGILQDITHLKLAQYKLNENESRFKAFMENIPAAAWICDENGYYEYINSQYPKILKVPADLTGKNIAEVYPEDIANLYLEDNKAVFNQSNTRSSIKRGIRPDGTPGQYMVTKFLLNQENQRQKIGGIAIDVTEQAKIDEQLLNQQRFLKGITEYAPLLMSYWTRDLICSFTNQTAKEWLGTELKDIVGHTMKDVLGDALFALNLPYIQRALQGEAVQFERGGFNIHGVAGYIWIQYVPDVEDGEVKGFYSIVTDITELKKAQIAIEFEERDKEALINSSQDYICSIDRNYNIITANAAYKNLMEAVTGIPVKKGDNVRTGSGFDEATWQLWESFFQRALAGESFTVETSTKPEGLDWEMWTECSFNPIVQNGEITGLACYSHDITERKKAALALKNSEEKFRSLVHSISDIIALVDENGIIQYVSSSVKAIMGYEENEVVGTNMFELIHPGDHALVFTELQTALQQPDYTTTLEIRLLNKQGQYIYLETKGSNQLNNPLIKALLINCRDITERRTAESKLRESKAQLDLVLDTVTDIIYVLEVEPGMRYKLLLANRVISGINLQNKQDIVGRYIEEYIPPERYNHFKEKLLLAVETKQTVKWEQLFINGNTRFYGIQTLTPVFDEHGNCIQVIGSVYDITDRKNAEQAILESYKKLEDYKFALDQSSLVYIADADGYITYVNDNLCNVSKYSAEELIGIKPSILDSGYHTPAFFEAIWQITRSGKTWRGQVKNKAKDGSFFWLESTVTPFLDGEGNPYQYLSINSDITQTKLAEEALAASNERFEYVTQATFDAIWDWDIVEGTILFSSAYKTLFGYEAGVYAFELFEKYFTKTHPDDIETVLNSLYDSVYGTSMYWSKDYRFRKSNNEYAYVLDKATIVRNKEGKAVRMIGAMQDITDRRRAIAELEKSELKFRSMVHNINDVITLVDENGFVLYSSPSLSSVLGYTPEEVNGLKIFTLLHPDDYARSKEVFKKILSTQGNSDIIEFRYRHKNGQFLIMESQGNNQMRNPAVNALILTTRDITKRREKEEERKLLVYELLEKNADLKQFSYITSHNLRAPLTNLMAICNLLDTEGLSQEDTMMMINAFKVATAKLNETLNDLIKILIIKDGKGQELEEISFEEIFAAVVRSISGIVEGASTIINADFSAAPSVYFYKSYLESIFLNLLTNAIKYAHPERPPAIEVKTQEDKKFVILTFKDNGIGMTMSRVQNKIFGLYQRFHNKIDGKGIGLYLVHSQVTGLGGTITVDSKENEGTTFTIKLKKTQ